MPKKKDESKDDPIDPIDPKSQLEKLMGDLEAAKAALAKERAKLTTATALLMKASRALSAMTSTFGPGSGEAPRLVEEILETIAANAAP